MKQRDFLLWLLLVPGVGIVGRTRVWEYMVVHGLNELSLQEVHQLAGVPQQQRASSRVFCQSDVATRQFEKLKTTHYVTIADEEYPTWLAEIDCPPVVLFYQGDGADVKIMDRFFRHRKVPLPRKIFKTRISA